MHELLHLIHLNMISTDFSNYASGVKICYVNLIDMFYTRIRAMQKDCCHDLYNHRDSSLLF